MSALLMPALMSEIPVTPETKKWLSFTPGTTVMKLVDGQGGVLGFCGFYVKGDTMWIGSDYVFPEFRGQGHHRSMLKARVFKARATGCKIARARCNSMSLPNYLREGFVALSRTKHRTLVEMRLT
jgi:GNAT superfamily N-acetyltransferase